MSKIISDDFFSLKNLMNPRYVYHLFINIFVFDKALLQEFNYRANIIVKSKNLS